ncbi:MAG: ABC transporter permease [Mucilaginibacter polytrichastri]|nr:ABC transporter permease [Mucilaginibacter polytrichastri]
MNTALFIARRLTFTSKRTFSRLIVRIAIAGIMLGLGVMILSLAIVKGFKQEIREKVRGFSGDIQLLKFDLNNSYEKAGFSLDADTLKRITNIAGIKKVMPFASKPGIIKADTDIEGVVLKGVDQQYDWALFRSVLAEGRVIDFSDSVKAQQEIMISRSTANRLRMKLGDSFLMYFIQEPLRRRKFTIVGIYDLGVEEVDKTYVVGALSLIRRLNNWDDKTVGGYELRVDDFDRIGQVDDRLNAVIPVKLRSYTVMQNYASIFEWLALLDVNTQVILILMLAVATINMISALLIMILEKTNMIGVLKAMGYPNSELKKVFLYNAGYLVFFGILLGNMLGLGVAFLQQKTHLLKLDQASYYMRFVPIELHFRDVLLLNLGTILICLLVLLIPSSLVSRINPVKAIQFK